MGQIGSGGMGLVLASKHPELGYEVAIKVLNSPDANDVQRERLRREAAILSRLRHPSLVEVIEWGDIDGAPWVAMRRVTGPSLGDQLRDHGPLAIPEVYRLGLELSSALEVAHQGGVLHRDVKPENVISSDPFVLVDFGLAKELSPEHSQALTRTGSLQGSPGFLAPEQARGKGRHATPATDVYGLGATLYAALLAKAPIEAESMMEVLIATCERPPLPPSELRPGVDPSLERIVLRCLAKDPAERFASVRELREALASASLEPREGKAGSIVLRTLAGLSLLGLGFAAAYAALSSQVEGSPPAETQLTSPKASRADTSRAPEPASPTPAPSRSVAPASESELRGSELLRRAAEFADQGLFRQAQRTLERGVAQGNGEACYDLASGLRSWRGIRRDPQRATELMDRALALGNERALFFSFRLLRKRGKEAEALALRERAIQSLRARIALGDTDAMCILAMQQWLTRRGAEETKRFSEEKDELLRRAAELGNVRAMAGLSHGATPEALAWRGRAAELGHPQSMMLEGLDLFKAGRRAEALRYYRAAGEKRVHHATEVGRVYAEGLHGVEVDLEQAVRYFRLAARLARDANQSYLGETLVRLGGANLEEGIGILEQFSPDKGWANTRLALAEGYWQRRKPGDVARCRRLLEALDGTPVGLCVLARALRHGTHGFRKDPGAAWERWTEAATRFQSREARCALGEELLLGEIRPQDPVTAYELFGLVLRYPIPTPSSKQQELLARAKRGRAKAARLHASRKD
jgi:serine/threonine protein kinase